MPEDATTPIPDPDQASPEAIAAPAEELTALSDKAANAEDAERLEATDNGPTPEDGDQPDQPAPAGEDVPA